MWQKLLFWFNKCTAIALPSAAIPFGQRYIKIKLQSPDKLIFRSAAVYELYKVTTKVVNNLPQAFVPGVGGLYDLTGVDVADGNQYVKFYQVPKLTNGTISYPAIEKAELYVNNLFTHPTIHDIYVLNIGFSLIRIHKL